jgi:hypothetical protein
MSFEIELIDSSVGLKKIEDSAKQSHQEFTKAVIDIKKEIIAIGSELHADEEEFLLKRGSSQSDLWGINLYPEFFGTESFLEFDSMINIRLAQANRSRNVEDESIRSKIKEIICKLIRES